MSVEYVEKIYNRYSSVYDVIFGRVFQSGREMAPGLLELSPGADLLEVGVGTGLSLATLPRNISITGIDLSQKMLNKAEKRIVDLRLENTRLIRMDATRLDFPDNSFDRVLAAYFISTVPDPVAVVGEMKRVCRPNGYLVFLNHFLNEKPPIAFLEKALSPMFYHLGFYTDLDLDELMRSTNLEVEVKEDIDFMGHWKAVRCVNNKTS